MIPASIAALFASQPFSSSSSYIVVGRSTSLTMVFAPSLDTASSVSTWCGRQCSNSMPSSACFQQVIPLLKSLVPPLVPPCTVANTFARFLFFLFCVSKLTAATFNVLCGSLVDSGSQPSQRGDVAFFQSPCVIPSIRLSYPCIRPSCLPSFPFSMVPSCRPSVRLPFLPLTFCVRWFNVFVLCLLFWFFLSSLFFVFLCCVFSPLLCVLLNSFSLPRVCVGFFFPVCGVFFSLSPCVRCSFFSPVCGVCVCGVRFSLPCVLCGVFLSRVCVCGVRFSLPCLCCVRFSLPCACVCCVRFSLRVRCVRFSLRVFFLRVCFPSTPVCFSVARVFARVIVLFQCFSRCSVLSVFLLFFFLYDIKVTV